jgi:hypothetical protein
MDHGLDFSKFDFKKIFRAVVATESLKRNQTRPLRSEVQEIAIKKYSGGQLEYCGDSEHGRDFLGIHTNLAYESKASDGLFQKTTGMTKSIVLKNFRGKNLGEPEKTFDYMFLWDTTKMSAGIASWDACMKHIDVNDAVINTRIEQKDIEWIAVNIEPDEAEDFGEKLKKLIEEAI